MMDARVLHDFTKYYIIQILRTFCINLRVVDFLNPSTTGPGINHSSSMISILRRGGGGGVQAYRVGKNDFELEVGGEGQDTSRVVLGPYIKDNLDRGPREDYPARG